MLLIFAILRRYAIFAVHALRYAIAAMLRLLLLILIDARGRKARRKREAYAQRRCECRYGERAMRRECGSEAQRGAEMQIVPEAADIAYAAQCYVMRIRALCLCYYFIIFFMPLILPSIITPFHDIRHVIYSRRHYADDIIFIFITILCEAVRIYAMRYARYIMRFMIHMPYMFLCAYAIYMQARRSAICRHMAL